MAGFLPRVSQDVPFGDVNVVSSRTCIRGRANRVAVLTRKGNIDPQQSEALAETPDSETARRSSRIKKLSVCEGRRPPASSVHVPPPQSTTVAPIPPSGEASPAAVAVLADTAPPSNRSTKTRRNASVDDASPNPTEALADACAVYEFGDLELTEMDDGSIPTQIVFKDSWSVGGSIELDTYSPTSGQFGVPILW